jgi:uncharacterized integral membrane protein
MEIGRHAWWCGLVALVHAAHWLGRRPKMGRRRTIKRRSARSGAFISSSAFGQCCCQRVLSWWSVVASSACRYNPSIQKRIEPVQSFTLIVKIVLFLLLLGFAALNSDSVTLRYFLGMAWQAPLSLVILAAFAVGLLTGLLGCSLRLLRNQRELRTLRLQINSHPINSP